MTRSTLDQAVTDRGKVTIDRFVTIKRSPLIRCYEQALTTNSSLGGTFHLDFIATHQEQFKAKIRRQTPSPQRRSLRAPLERVGRCLLDILDPNNRDNRESLLEILSTEELQNYETFRLPAESKPVQFKYSFTFSNNPNLSSLCGD